MRGHAVVAFVALGCGGNPATLPDGHGAPGDAAHDAGPNLDLPSSQHAYIKASNTDADDLFGAVALSADGSTLVVGAPRESSAAKGVGGSQTDNSALESGAAYVFVRAGDAWTQQAYVKASDTMTNAGFGTAVSLSADGSTLAVGAAGVSVPEPTGRVYIFRRTGTTWTQEVELHGATSIGDAFGRTLSLSADGGTLAVGAFFENCMGSAYVFARAGATWSQVAYVMASNAGFSDWFGSSVALSADASTLAVGAPYEDSAATGINGDQQNDNANGSGAVYVFTRSGGAWSQSAYVKASNARMNGNFGRDVALTADASVLLVGSSGETGAATGVDGSQADGALPQAGAAYVFTRQGASWTQESYLKASNTYEGYEFGARVAISGDGTMIAIGANGEDGSSRGLDGIETPSDATLHSGAVYMFTRGSTTREVAYVKASNADKGDSFGDSLAISGDGTTLAVGAQQEASGAKGVGGNQSDNAAMNAGAVYVFQ